VLKRYKIVKRNISNETLKVLKFKKKPLRILEKPVKDILTYNKFYGGPKIKIKKNSIRMLFETQI